MGNKLESSKKKSEQGKKTLDTAKETGQKAVGDAKKMSALIKELPSDIDDDVKSAADAVKEGTKRDAESFMESTVKTNVEAGRSTMKEVSGEAKKQIESNNKVLDAYRQMNSIRDFGSSARSSGMEKTQQNSKGFEDLDRESTSASEAAQQELNRQKSEMSGLF